MNKDVSVIITLYKTPAEKLKSLNQYKNYPILIFDQSPENDSKKKIRKILKFKFKYFYSKKNLGNSKTTNFLIKKVKTKYCLFTQADISINTISIATLIRTIKKRNDVIFATPNFQKKTKLKKTTKKNYDVMDHINASCMLCDVKKVKKIGFFDEDFFLYWNDEDLIKRVNKTNFKMIKVLNAFAIHESSKSSLDLTSIALIRSKYFKYGELMFDYKHKKLRFIKILRQLVLNSFFMIFNLFLFKKKKFISNFGYILGIVLFLKFYFLKKIKL